MERAKQKIADLAALDELLQQRPKIITKTAELESLDAERYRRYIARICREVMPEWVEEVVQ